MLNIKGFLSNNYFIFWIPTLQNKYISIGVSYGDHKREKKEKPIGHWAWG